MSDETSLDRLLRLYSILREGMSALLADKQASHAVHAELHPWLDRERRRVMAVYVHRSEPWDNGYCRGWYDYTGGTPETHLGSGRMQSVHPEDKAGAQCVFERADASRSAFSLDLRLWRSDGVYRWVTDSGVPRFDSRGRFLGFVGSVEDNHDRKIAEQSLKEALRVRDEFLSVASHELKTPLTSLKLLAQRAQRLLAHGGGLASENATEVFVRLLVQTNRSVERLSRLVDDMLDVSSIASGRLALRTEKMDLGAVVQDVVERLRPPSHGSLGSLGSAPHRARRGFGRLRRAWARPLHRETNRRAPRRANSSPQRAR